MRTNRATHINKKAWVSPRLRVKEVRTCLLSGSNESNGKEGWDDNNGSAKSSTSTWGEVFPQQ